MLGDSLWLDPRTVVATAGFMFGILSFFWNRRENRLDALSKALQPMVRAVQCIQNANRCRYAAEQLKRSFPKADLAQEAAERVNKFVSEYNGSIKASEEHFRSAESEFAARSFRFPDKVSRLVKSAMESVSAFGRLVNAGRFDEADIQLATFRDDYRHITRFARGWRLVDPFEGIRRYFRRKDTSPPPDPWGLTDKDMDAIFELIHRRATSQAQNTFAVHPPRKLIDHPEIAKSDDVINQLANSVFVVVLQDGTTRMMSLVELIVFTYNLILLAQQHREVATMLSVLPPAERDISVKFRFSTTELMRPETVKALLEKIEFSNVASDDLVQPAA